VSWRSNILGVDDVPTARVRLRQSRVTWWLVYAALLFVSLGVALLAHETVPQPFSLAVVVFMVAAAIAVARPRLGTYLLVLLVIIGDTSSAPWYPFAKNLSSAESILFLSHQVKVSPLEVCLCGLVVGWILQMLSTRRWRLERGHFFRPLAVFTGFLLLAFGYGIARGGQTNIALLELRPILYLFIFYIVLTNVMTRREEYERLFWCVMVGVLLNSFLAIRFLEGLTIGQRQDLESLGDHSASLVMNLMFVLFFSAWMYRRSSPFKRFLLPVMMVPVVFTYLTAQRRAAVIGLIGSLFLLAAMLFWKNRRAFWVVVPIAAILSIGYVGAFWHSSGSGVAFPALAVKSVIAPNQVDTKDQTSSQYRELETRDVVYTIKTNPITGMGFGHKFLRPYVLPAITTFQLAEYLTHNSILWIWMNTGIGGFLAMLYLFAITLRVGARTVRLQTDPDYAAITLTSVAFVLMFALFTYVDISWDTKSMIVLALALAQIDHAARSVAPAPSESVTESPAPTTPRLVSVPASSSS
jgi:O-antigen ligase